MRDDPLLTPYTLKHLTLKNRLMTSAHEPAYPEDGMPKARYRAYHEERAKGGLALTMTAGSAVVSRSSPPAFNNILAYKDEVVPWMAELADACHAHDCKVMIQLTHLGWRSRWDWGDWLPSVAPGPRREPAHRAAPKVMEEFDIARAVSDFADAAERMKTAGLDGVEIEAYGHLLDAFLSGYLNHLEPPHGGATLEARMEVPLTVLRAVRDRVGPDFVVGIRLTADDRQPGGISEADGLAICARLRDEALVDFINVVRGRLDNDATLTETIPVQGMRSAPHLDFAGKVRAEIGLPTFHAARISDVATARHAVANGLLDMVGMTRPHLADPHIIRKIVEGREDEIRPCVGANYCLDRIYTGNAALCIHNPSTGRELTMPHLIEPAASRKRVVVVGAGPGGLEAARVAAVRGHQVTLMEAASQAGGQVRLTAQDPRRKEMLGIIDWRLTQCEAHGVEVRYNTFAEADDVLGQTPDVVVIATGGLPDVSVLEKGNELAVTGWDILTGDVKPGEDVLIYDEAGDHVGLQAARIIASAGGSVEVMTRDRTIAPEVMGMNLAAHLKALQTEALRMTVGRRLLGLSREGNRVAARIGTDFNDWQTTRSYDQVVVNQGITPLADLYFELKPNATNAGEIDEDALVSGEGDLFPKRNPEGAFVLYRIGDAVSSRNTHAAIYDALRTGVRW